MRFLSRSRVYFSFFSDMFCKRRRVWYTTYMKQQTDLTKIQESTSKKLCIAAVYPVLIFYLTENFTHNPWADVRPYAQAFNLFLFELAAVVLILLTGSVRISLSALGGVSFLYGLINAYVLRFRSVPLVPWDIFSLKTAASVADNYNFTPDVRIAVVTVLFLLLFVSFYFLRVSIRCVTIRVRLLFAFVAALALVGFCCMLQKEEFQNRYRLYNKRFTPVFMANADGLAVTFVMNLPYVFVEKPDGYSAKEAEEMFSDLEEEAKETAEKQTADLPNIIVMMNESFADLSALGEFVTNRDVMPYLHSLQKGAKNTVTGMLHVSVCGGNTPNTEFEFLTGNTMAFLPQGSIPFQQYIKQEMPSLASHLKQLGYRTVAMHPYQSSGWERDRVYPLLGFERSIFLRDFYGEERVRQYVSDQACVDKIIDLYEKKAKGTPLFLFNVTMQNHGGYQEIYPNFSPDISAEGMNSVSLSQYLSLVSLSDQALSNLIDYFAGQQEKTVVVFFGDHQPNDAVAAPVLAANGMRWNALNDEQIKLRYQVPYVIWANFEIEAQTNADLSANYLGAEVLSRAGVPQSGYQKFVMDLEETWPILSAVNTEQADGDGNESLEKLSEYKKLQYYQIFGK